MALSLPPAVFLFGTLRDLNLLEVVLGAAPDVSAAELPGARVARAKGQSYPLLVAAEGQNAQGLVLRDLSAEQLARLDYYEAPYEYTRTPAQLDVGPADVYRPPSALAEQGGEDWSLDAWQAEHGPLMREAAVEIMEGFGSVDPGLIAARMPVIRIRAQQRVNARARVTPTRLRRAHDRSDVSVSGHRRPYSHFFTVEEIDVAPRRFDGVMPQPSERAVFMMSDAVTVLPYDPKRDRVLLIEQFRAGAYLRGDANPWALEAIAGRQDPGETSEQTARREALEETGLRLGEMELVARYYASSGCCSEYMTSFVAVADLPDGIEGVGGVEGEAEDIRSMLVPFEALQEALASGEAENGPLVMSALWLAMHRDRLRGTG